VHRQPFAMLFVLLLVGGIMYSTILLLFVVAVTSGAGRHIKTCYLMFGPINDGGYTFQHNAGRRVAHDMFSSAFPIDSEEIPYEPAANFKDHRRVMQKYVDKGCDIIVAGGAPFIDTIIDFTRAYRNVTWALQNAFAMESTEPDLIVYGTRSYEPYFALGVAAAMEARRCIAIVVAYDDDAQVVAPTNALQLGIRSVLGTSSLGRLHVIPVQAWYDPEADRAAARAIFDNLGCDVMGHYTDPVEVNDFVAVELEEKIFSFGVHTDSSAFFGDSVLSSVYSDWSGLFFNMSAEEIENPPAATAGGTRWASMREHATLIAPLSSRAQQGTKERVAEVVQGLQNGSVQVFCSDLNDESGVRVWNSSSQPTGCMSDAEIRGMSYYVEGIVHHPRFQLGSVGCSAGQSFEYALSGSGLLSLVCTTCPPDTYASAPSPRCLPCSSGFVSTAGSADCTPIAPPSDWHPEIVMSVAVIVVMLAALTFAVAINRRGALKNKLAPRSAPLCIVFTDVESSTKLWAADPVGMSEAMRIHHARPSRMQELTK
jgi:basic membrane protein A